MRIRLSLGSLVIFLFNVITFAQRQYFEVRPSNVTVTQGDTAILQCTVGNQAQQGHTHWTKDGAVLGFEDSLPGWPRYQVIGNHGLGEYHLEISAADIEDDAEYECQVQPGEGEDVGLRAKAYLNVQIPPVNVTLEGAKNGVIMEARMDTMLDITCRVSGAKPAADIRWYKNGASVPERMYHNRVIAQDEKRSTTVSQLRWTASKEDNGAIFTCDVVHPALAASRSLKTQITLSVIYPPGVPMITGYEPGRILISEEFLQLRCKVENGNPPPELIWYRNSIVVAKNSTSALGHTRNDYGFTVKSIDDDADYRCEASNLATVTPLSSSVRLKVYFPPEKVIIYGPDGATVGDTVTFECKSSASNPQAKIEWLVDGHPWSDHTQRNEPASIGTGIESSSSIDVKVTQQRPEMVIECAVMNEHLQQTSKRGAITKKSVKIYYPPESVKITHNDDKLLVSGETILLTCTATGGYPAATLEWFRNEKRVTNGTSSKHGASNSAISELTLTLSPHNNLEQIQCRAYNLASGSDRLTAITTLHVLFPPAFVRISPDPVIIQADIGGELTCDSGPSNPAPNMEWYTNGELQGNSMEVHRKTGKDGGVVVRKKLAIQPMWTSNGDIYECRAWAEIPGTNPVSEKIAISVHYKPRFLTLESSSVQKIHEDVMEGERILLNATSDANPSVEQYTWYKDDMTYVRSTPPRITVNGPILEITNVQRGDAGMYTCRARNQIGISNLTALINVKYSPDIKNISPYTHAATGDNVTLFCEVDAYPLNTLSIRWETKDGDRISPGHRFIESVSNGRGTLTIFGIRVQDTGRYFCKADNTIGVATKESAVLVKQAPVINKELTTHRIAMDEKKNATMHCVVDGVPDVVITWHKDSFKLSENDRFHFMNSDDGLTRFTSTFQMTYVQEHDYGTYHCVAQNEMGTKIGEIIFQAPDVPDPPRDIHVTNSTHDSVALSWKPGFDGGEKQRYRIRYSLAGSNHESPNPHQDPHRSDYPNVTIENLRSATKYVFFIESWNKYGVSNFTKSYAETKEEGQKGIVQENVEEEIPVLIIILVCLVGVLLLVLNAALVVCFIRRHRRKKLQEKAANARLGCETVNGRKIQMYSSSDAATGTTAVGSVSPTMTTARADSRYGNVSDAEQSQRPQSAMSDDDNSIRTIIEVDGNLQPYYNRLDASPRTIRPIGRTTMDSGCVTRDYGGTSPSNAMYADTIRSNSLQRQLAANPMYSVPSTPFHPDQNKNPYAAAQLSEDVVPPTMGPLRSLSQELNNYAAFSHYHPLPSTSSNSRHQHGPKRYSPPQSSQPGPISTVVHTNGRTPYAEVRPILTTNHSQSQHQGQLTNGDRNGSPILSTFASTPRTSSNTKADFLDLDNLAGDLV